MLLRYVQVGGWEFTFRLDGGRRLVAADGTRAWAEYWPALTAALGLAFGLGEG